MSINARRVINRHARICRPTRMSGTGIPAQHLCLVHFKKIFVSQIIKQRKTISRTLKGAEARLHGDLFLRSGYDYKNRSTLVVTRPQMFLSERSRNISSGRSTPRREQSSLLDCVHSFSLCSNLWTHGEESSQNTGYFISLRS